MKTCHNCKAVIEDKGSTGRADTCFLCDSDLHCCLNCRFHAIGTYNECLENSADRVLENEISNFCDYFSFRDMSEKERTNRETGEKEGNPLDALFR